MLIWACDLIVAADNAKFSDVVAVRLGMPGVEYYAHPWEFGPRKAKELLLTGDSVDADEAYRLGMVSKVFPVDELADKTLEFARRIAERPTMASLLIKDSVNAASDAMGYTEALRHAFHIHELGHAHWAAFNENRFPVGHAAARRGLAQRQAHQAGPPRYALDRRIVGRVVGRSGRCLTRPGVAIFSAGAACFYI